MTPSILAHMLAREIGLSAGNMWEPAIVRNVEKRLCDGAELSQVEADLRFALNLPQRAASRKAAR